MANCRECGCGVEAWHHVLLCDRCLGARNWYSLEDDDYVLIRRERGGTGRVWLSSNIDGNSRSTDLTALRLDPLGEVVRRVSEIFEDGKPRQAGGWSKEQMENFARYGVCRECGWPRESSRGRVGLLEIVCPNGHPQD